MLRILSFVLVLVAGSWALPALAADYESKELADAGAQYKQDLLDKIPDAKRKPALIPRLKADAAEEYKAKRYERAIDDLETAISYGADDGLVWLRLAQAQFADSDEDHAMASAYNAYRKSTDPVERAEGLFIIGRDYDRHDKYKEALAAFQAGVAFNPSPGVATRIDQLKALVAFRVIKVEVEAEADAARACLRFNEPIATKGDVSYGAYVRSTPELAGIVTGRADTVCLEGLKHGETYQVSLLAGFPSSTGEKTLSDFKTNVVVPDRKPAISFSGTGYVLPREGSAGLPVTTVNLDRVKIRILKVNERNLVPSLDAEKLTTTTGTDDVDTLASGSGSLIWQGEMTIKGERNRAVTTAIPLKDILKDKGPGVYLAAVERADVKEGEDTQIATNWILVSNLGLTTYTGSDDMIVAARSLNDAKPVSGVTLKLYAHDNAELGTATTDKDGIARFAAGLLHGKGGDEPYAIMAYGADGDYNFLEVGRPAFDLSDRGVSGRAPPGPVDAYLYTDRGIYRPGENVHLIALVRDSKVDALANVPLTLKLLRPDGIAVDTRQLDAGSLGGHYQMYALPRDARMGTWTVELHVDPKAPAIGSASFRVEDFVPPTLKVEVSAGDAPIHPNEAYPISILGKYYYGAPGAGLAVEAHAQIAFAAQPFPSEPDFQFGLIDEKFDGVSKDLDAPATDNDGKSSAELNLTDLPDLTRQLDATISVSVYEPSGRAISADITRPIRERGVAIGLRTNSGDDAVAEGQPSKVDVIAVDEAGKRIAAPGLRWELIRERWQYDWYSASGAWRYRRQVRDEPIDSGAVDVPDGNMATLSKNLPAGRYRWEISDAKSGAQSSVRFHVGWWVEAELPDVPDKLTATLDKKSYHAGDTAKLFVKAPFAGEAELAIASDKVVSLKSFTLPEGGTTLEIPVDANWGSGVYALVSAYRPPAPPDAASAGTSARGPGRAVGVAWLGVDPAPRMLAVTLTAPDVARPRGPVTVPVKIAGLDKGEEAYVTLAAVDEAVLKLTDFTSPSPGDYFFEKQELGVELRDLYGRLIDPHAGAVGVLRSGGDNFMKRATAGLPDKSNRVVALFSGIVKLDAGGAANVTFDVPDFQGQLRLMAVAYAAHKVGAASAAMTVRDPVVTMVALPRFLAPGDNARLAVTNNNLEGPAGDYALKMTATGAGSFATPVDRTIHLDTGANFNDGFVVTGTTVGNIAAHLELTGPGNTHIARDFTIGVRPAQSYQLRRFVGQLAPGQSVTLDDSSADQFLPGTAEAVLSVSPRPEWDVPSLLRALDRYPYGCLEQTTSRALPLLYVSEVAKLWQTDPGFDPAKQIDGAIGHIAELQRSDGSFGVWSDSDNTVPWLDAYAADFLIRAQEHGNTVPDFALKGVIGWLQNYVKQEHKDDKDLPALAYAHYVLARAKADDLGTLRYFNDTALGQLPTQLAKAQLAAALALYGDTTRAQAAYAAALAAPPTRDKALRFVDYGSELRDSAAALAFAAGDPANQARLTAVIDRIAELFAKADRTSTQEQAWLLLAAEAAAKVTGNSMTVAVGDKPAEARDKPEYFRRAVGVSAPSLTVANRGTQPLWRSVSITGVEKAELPAESHGYAVTRQIYNPDGTGADLTKARQTDLFVVVLAGTRKDSGQDARALIVDLLPAGFEIQNVAAPTNEASGAYSWLKDVSSPDYNEARDDRYIAALDLPSGTADFKLAYVVRAITPGTFKYPALDVEDMYDPETYGRTAMGALTVQPR
ncbi:MAG TPA: MG2 domain-containing protein [Stellaceae bacterium]|nr:MG2 domain-containing protein [Stellaceae bacterium]